MSKKDKETTPGGLSGRWADLHKAWVANLNDLMEQASTSQKSFFAPDAFQAFSENWVKTQSEFLRKGFEMNHLFPTPELAERFTHAMETQLQVFRWWADTMVKTASEGGMGDPQALVETWRKSYGALMEHMIPTPLTDPFKALLGSTTDWPSNLASLTGEWSKVWTDMMKRGWSTMSAAPDGFVPPKQIRDFYDSWIKGYEETLGRWFKLPSIGPLRRNQEHYQEALDSYVRLCAASFDYANRLLEPSIKAFEELTRQTAELMKGDITPETFRQIYQQMVQSAEKQFHVLFESDEFVRSLQTTLEASLSFYHQSQKLTEDYLKVTPVITRTEMDEVHEEVYELRREIDELRQQVKKIATAK
jgi:class III poly(R)-hydroxyalkanoic acid synthase PhaE subunit